MQKTLREAIVSRRSVYNISKKAVVSDDEIMETVRRCVKYAPSAFNSQSGRLLVLFGDAHDKLWDIVMDILKKRLAPERFSKTEEKLNKFKKGYATILVFEDQATVTRLSNENPAYKDTFPLWSLQSSGMLQYLLWASLEDLGFGASLQHYNPLIDEQVRQTWGVPEEWKLLSQIPFGKPTEAPGEKTFCLWRSGSGFSNNSATDGSERKGGTFACIIF